MVAVAASRVSSAVATDPPTWRRRRARRPPPRAPRGWCRSGRRTGQASRTASTGRRPGRSRPGTPRRTPWPGSTTAAAASRAVRTSAGLLAPAGKCRARVSWPATDSGVPRNCSASGARTGSRRAEAEDEQDASDAATTAAGRATRPGDAGPRPRWVWSGPPTRGMHGQKSGSRTGPARRAAPPVRRPPRRRSRGRWSSKAAVARRGEQQRQQGQDDRDRAGDDAGSARCSARRIASCRSSWRRSSSR